MKKLMVILCLLLTLCMVLPACGGPVETDPIKPESDSCLGETDQESAPESEEDPESQTESDTETETEEEPSFYTQDGIHPTPNGACYIGETYLKAVAPLIELLSKEDE